MEAHNILNFPLSTAFIGSHKFGDHCVLDSPGHLF
ncbi:hypothetical protein T4B_13923 [Trichinella pseudospiralis]|uniref:Uncharacterized protein n=1 Tax=Trichinella pseudospiralis TaxID=6337 RepID=A0A0V1GK72_TRIPS|nr:hypothetical protein T4B_13923 [Trichinella pseudospiralis]